MALKVELISKETIKPSSPTPHHLRLHQLSFIDGIAPPLYNPWIYFYPPPPPHDHDHLHNYSKTLQTSLSHYLLHFYPLAGRLRDTGHVDCNDEGVPFLQTRVCCSLSDLLSDPLPSELGKLLPFHLDDPQEILLGVQFNAFDCGGVAVGVCLSHKVADASSVFNFLNGWAAAARGVAEERPRPDFAGASHFPPKNIMILSNVEMKEKIVAKRLIFSSDSIEALTRKCLESATETESPQRRRPSRVQVLSAFLWSRIVASTGVENGSGKRVIHQVVQLVNLRPRMDPPLPDHAFGNYYSIVMTTPSDDAVEEPFRIVAQLRESVRKVDSEHAKDLRDFGDKHIAAMIEADAKSEAETVRFCFTSLCKFPAYEADFGWGKPVWGGFPAMTSNNSVVFKDAIADGGIEAMIHLKEDDMSRFLQDKDILPFLIQSIVVLRY